MTKRESRPERQILNIGEVVDLDGYGRWAQVESYDESADIYWVTDRNGEGYEYVDFDGADAGPDNWKDADLPNPTDAPTYGDMKDEKGLADAHTLMAECQREYDEANGE